MKLTRREFVKLGLAAGASLVLPKLARADNPPSILWIGWDGADYRTVSALLREGRLPNLANLYTVRLDAVGATVTKPGWVEIVTGYEYPKTEVFDNNWNKYSSTCLNEACNSNPDCCAYKEVPLERILFYRIKSVGYWSGCIFSKIGHTGDAPGEPWAQLIGGGLDYYKNATNGGLGVDPFSISETNQHLLEEALPLYNASGKPGLMFCHYSRPDYHGHHYGMDSPQYLRKTSKGLDTSLGLAIAAMDPKPDIVIVCSDHGFDGPGSTHHGEAPHGFISCNLPLANNCVRRDVGYTVSKMAGLPVNAYVGADPEFYDYPDDQPPLRGKDIRKV